LKHANLLVDGVKKLNLGVVEGNSLWSRSRKLVHHGIQLFVGHFRKRIAISVNVVHVGNTVRVEVLILSPVSPVVTHLENVNVRVGNQELSAKRLHQFSLWVQLILVLGVSLGFVTLRELDVAHTVETEQPQQQIQRGHLGVAEVQN